MATPSEIAADLIRGKAYFSMLNANNIAELFKGCSCNGDNKLSVCLARIVKSLQYRADQGIYDDITDTLYIQMILIIGEFSAAPLSKFYYTTKINSVPLTVEEILALPFIEAMSGTNPIIPFSAGVSPQFALMAENVTEPIKTKWQDTVVSLNNGNIGASTDTFGILPIVGNFRVYQTNYATQFPYPIEFKKT